MRDAARFLGSLVVRRWPWGSHYLTVGTLKLNVAPDTSRFIPCNGYSRVAALAYPAETLTARINLNERPVATLSTRDPLLSFFSSFTSATSSSATPSLPPSHISSFPLRPPLSSLYFISIYLVAVHGGIGYR